MGYRNIPPIKTIIWPQQSITQVDLKARETYLSIAHIDELIEDITPIEAEYINAFKDERRKKESTLARIELQNLCMQRYGKTLSELNFQKNSN